MKPVKRRVVRRDNVFPWLNMFHYCGPAVIGLADLSDLRMPNAGLPSFIMVDPMNIRFRDRLSQGEGHNRLFLPGDWDLLRSPMEEMERTEPRYRLPVELNTECRPLEKTSEFDLHMERIRKSGSSRKLRSREEALAFLQSVADVNASMLASGYLSQAQLGMGRFSAEVEVTVDRHGCLMKRANGGNHRFALARFHRIPRIPVTVTAIHSENLMRLSSHTNWSGLTSLREFLLDLARTHQ